MIKLVQVTDDPDKILTTPTEPVEVQAGDNPEANEIKAKLRAGISTNPNLVGLAANQIGIKKSMCICQIEQDGKLEWVYMINPEILTSSTEEVEMVEGCGSMRDPEVNYLVSRPREIKLSYHDLKGKLVVLNLEEFSARVVQHEVDHLNGILISDRGSLFTPQ